MMRLLDTILAYVANREPTPPPAPAPCPPSCDGKADALVVGKSAGLLTAAERLRDLAAGLLDDARDWRQATTPTEAVLSYGRHDAGLRLRALAAEIAREADPDGEGDA